MFLSAKRASVLGPLLRMFSCKGVASAETSITATRRTGHNPPRRFSSSVAIALSYIKMRADATFTSKIVGRQVYCGRVLLLRVLMHGC